MLGDGAVLPGSTRDYLHDATESRGVRGRADAVALPADAAQVAEVVAWCYAHDVPLVPRGGGTGFTGGAVPDGGVVLSLERLREPVALEPELWRARVPAGMTTAELARRARETGLFYPPDPGAAEQSQLGGNIATNAGGPHTFKYGVTGTWVTGLELVAGARGARQRRRSGPQGRRRLRHQVADDRLRGHAGDRHRRVAAADPRARRPAAGRRPVSRRGDGVRGARGGAGQRPAAGGARVPRRGRGRRLAAARFPARRPIDRRSC